MQQEKLKSEIEQVGDITIIRFNGNLDGLTCLSAQKDLQALVDDGAKNLLINFEAVKFVSSAGLRALLFIGKVLKETDGHVGFCAMNETVGQVFSVSGFDKIFEVYTDEIDGLDDFQI